MAKKFIKNKKKAIRTVLKGKIYIQSTFNNTIITITDEKGGVISWTSAGSSGFKGARKSTPYAAQIACKTAIDKAKNYGLNGVDIYVSGVGTGRESAVRAINGTNLTVYSINDTTPIAHNGCRPKKIRRV